MMVAICRVPSILYARFWTKTQFPHRAVVAIFAPGIDDDTDCEHWGEEGLGTVDTTTRSGSDASAGMCDSEATEVCEV